MTGNPASASVLALAGCLMCLSLPSAAATAHAQQAHSSEVTSVVPQRPSTAQRFDFDIPAQALDAALDRYAAASQRPVLFPSELVVGRASAAVRGRYLPEEALNLLLRNTGLIAEKDHGGPADAFVLAPADASADAAPSYAGIDALVGDSRIPGLIQAQIWRALCASPRTAPGAYRGLLRFRLDMHGHMQDVRFLSSTGNARRDIAVLEALRTVQVGPLPLEIAQQPLTMVIVPGDQPGTPRCEKAMG